jgi:hypothetical protein
MNTLRQFLEETEDLKGLYSTLRRPSDIERHKRLEKMVYDAYRRGDHKTAERLDAELEDLEDRMDFNLEDMDDSDGEDVDKGNTGGEEEHIDRDWGVQDAGFKVDA